VPKSLSKILIHSVFSTKDRRPFLRDKTLREESHNYIGGIGLNDSMPLALENRE
jgi:hypothetical protein